jgi:hypothetical protein
MQYICCLQNIGDAIALGVAIALCARVCVCVCVHGMCQCVVCVLVNGRYMSWWALNRQV